MRVVILGAGVIGVTSAWYLAQAGHEVTMIVREAFERKRADFLPSSAGRAATSALLVAGLLYLQPAFRLADAAGPATCTAPPLRSWLPQSRAG